MSLDEILKELKKLLPNCSEDAFLENLALQSSYIIFDGANETLFRPGDAPKGFYWILSGQVMETVSSDVSVLMGKGSMIGLEEFLSSKGHLSQWQTRCRTEALFIDHKCFKNLMQNDEVSKRLHDELAAHLLRLKEACQSNPRILIRPA